MDIIKFSERYIPLEMDKSILHKDKINFIKNIKNLQHLLFYGYEGKTVLINLILNNLFGKLKLKFFNFSCSNKIIKCKHSDYHLEIDIKALNKTEKILFNLIDDYISTLSIINNHHKIIILYNFDLLDFKFQYKFRTIIEKSYLTTRFIIHSNKYSKIIEPIRSRCINIRVPTISNKEAIKFVKYIAKDNNLTINKNIIEKILSKSKNYIKQLSIRKLLYILFIKIESKNFKIRYPINFDNDLDILYKELYSKNNLLIKTESLNKIILNLLESNYCYINIMKYLLYNIIDDSKISDKNKYEIIKETAYLQYISNKGRVIINLEYYIIFLLNKLL